MLAAFPRYAVMLHPAFVAKFISRSISCCISSLDHKVEISVIIYIRSNLMYKVNFPSNWRTSLVKEDNNTVGADYNMDV